MHFFAIGANAQNPELFSSEDVMELEEVVEQFGILDKIKCKLCEKAMEQIVKEINKNSSKVGIWNSPRPLSAFSIH